jgi:hypothetical protein
MTSFQRWCITAIVSFVHVAAASSTLVAATFFSGRIDVNGSVAGGSAVMFARDVGQGSTGVSYNNAWTSGSGGLLTSGNKITTVGVIPLRSALVRNSSIDLGTGLNLVAVFAFEGIVEPGSGGAGTFQSNFNPDVAVPGGTLGGFGGGIVRFYDRRDPNTGVAPPFDLTDPAAWVQDFSDLSAGLVAELTVDFQATDYQQGPPGGIDTLIPQVNDVTKVNTIPFETSGAFAGAEGDFKLRFNEQLVGDMIGSGFLFNNPDVSADFNSDFIADPPGSFPRTTLDLLVNLDQELLAAPSHPVPMDIDDLNDFFDRLLDNVVSGSHPFSDESVGTGNDFDTSQTLVTGDASLLNVGGIGIPGGQFVPEPSAFVLLFVAAIGIVLRRKGR